MKLLFVFVLFFSITVLRFESCEASNQNAAKLHKVSNLLQLFTKGFSGLVFESLEESPKIDDVSEECASSLRQLSDGLKSGSLEAFQCMAFEEN